MPRFDYLRSDQETPENVWSWARLLIERLNAIFTGTDNFSAVPIGTVSPTVLAAEPVGWLICNGREVSQTDYPALAVALGIETAFFNIPDFRNKILMGAGTIIGLGVSAGQEEVTLTTNNLPAHTHPIADPGHTHTVIDAGHTHGVTDPGHVHTLGGSSANAVTAGAAAALTTNQNTGSATTGISVNNATTGIANQSASTGVSVGANETAGVPVSVLPPVTGINYMIKAY